MNTSESLFQSTLRSVVFAALGPALIMLQIGSLVFFFSEIIFQGRHQMPIHWIFGLFVFAVVLISRISIEEGFERAVFFGIALLGAVSFVSGVGVHTLVLAGAWWAASKLTWDCTFVDTSRDVTGQGLVKAAESNWRKWLTAIGWLPAPPAVSDAALEWRDPEAIPERVVRHDARREVPIEDPPSAERRIQSQLKRILWERRSTNTPGLWAFYFFVAGLPIFAIGQWFVRSDPFVKSYCIRLFAVYLFSGLALMMLTSLIGLTRYVRSRRAELSDAVARSWLLWGTGGAAVVVLAVVLFPWPTSGFSLSRFVSRFESRERIGNSPVSERGQLDGKSGGGPNDPRGAPGQTGQPPSSKEGQGGDPGGKQTGSQPQGAPGDKSGGSAAGGKGPRPAQQGAKSEQSDPKQQAGQKGQSQKSGQSSPTQKSDQSKQSKQSDRSDPTKFSSQPIASLFAFLSSILKNILLIALILIAVVMAFAYRRALLAGLRGFLAALAARWSNLFRGGAATASPDAGSPTRESWRRFDSYRDPFAAGRSASPAEIVQESFAVLEAFAREFGVRREPRETPLEFAGRVRRRFEGLQSEPLQLADLYSRLAYSGEGITLEAVAPLRPLWGKLREIYQRAQAPTQETHESTAPV